MANLPEVVSREEWLAARKELLAKEKELTRAHDRVNADRRRLPMVRVDKTYDFEGPDGKVGLLDLFEGRPQLVVHHFMWINDVDADGAEQPREVGCPSCSSAADGIGNLRQLHVRNTTLVAVTRAPYNKIVAFHARMGWTFPWYSSAGSDPSLQYRVVHLAGPGDRLAQSLPASAINMGIAFGSYVGGVAIGGSTTSAAVITGLIIAVIAIPVALATSFLKPPAVEEALALKDASNA